MEAKLWKNFTDEDFSWKWDGIVYTFKAGQEIYLEDFKAEHFTRHLVDREINKLATLDPKVRTDDASIRGPLEAQCYPTAEPVAPEVALDLNEKTKKRKAKKVEAEFEDLDKK